MDALTFAQTLAAWHIKNPRDMPWLETRNPYKIWISEIILQQTRVAQGWSYYLDFIQRFPDVFSLHEATESEVLTYWEGLGYYSRARNLKKAAAVLVENYNGIFPTSYAGLLELPGVGPYTAAAIAGFAFDLPHPVLDGNVIRFVSRIQGIEKRVDSPETKKEIKDFITTAIQHDKPSRFNQAIMNFGALVCKPGLPNCRECVFHSSCRALYAGKVESIPLKGVKPEKTNRYFHYFILKNDTSGHVWLHKREGNDIWKGLFEFPLVETKNTNTLTKTEIDHFLNTWKVIPDAKEEAVFLKHQQSLTHQKIHFTFYVFHITNDQIKTDHHLYRVPTSSLQDYAMPISLKNIWNRVKKKGVLLS